MKVRENEKERKRGKGFAFFMIEFSSNTQKKDQPNNLKYGKAINNAD